MPALIYEPAYLIALCVFPLGGLHDASSLRARFDSERQSPLAKLDRGRVAREQHCGFASVRILPSPQSGVARRAGASPGPAGPLHTPACIPVPFDTPAVARDGGLLPAYAPIVRAPTCNLANCAE